MLDRLSIIETLKDFVWRVDTLRIEYMVTGSFGMSVYIPARTTMDIDVVVEINDRDVDGFEKSFLADYYIDRAAIRRAIDRQSMFNIISLVNGVKLDCIIGKDDPFTKASFSRRRLAAIDDLEFSVITKEDLIISKLSWARESHSELQFRDISRLVESGYDKGYVRGWIERLGLSEVWAAVDEWKTQAEK